MRTLARVTLIVSLLATAPVALADARSDLRVEKEKDDDGNVQYQLINVGSRNVKAAVVHKKTCRSTTNRKQPSERDYWLPAKGKQNLRKVMANSDCRHEYRIVRAEYY